MSARHGRSRAPAKAGRGRAGSSPIPTKKGPGAFGWSVALSSDGNLALIGGPHNVNGPHDNIPDSAAWAFTRSGETWTGQPEKIEGYGTYDNVTDDGQSAALSSEGSTALLGAPESYRSGGAFALMTGYAEYGQCRELTKYTTPKVKQGLYSVDCDGAKPVKHGKPDGRFEWYPGPASSCHAVKKGEYTEAGCLTKAAKKNGGKFERFSCFSDQGGCAGYASTSGTVTLDTPRLGSDIVCSAGAGTGEITGTKTGEDRLTLTGCESSGRKCASEGPNSTPSGKPGVIDTNLLDTDLLLTVVKPPLVELTSSQHEPYLFEVDCEGQLLRTSGLASGAQTGNVSEAVLTSTTTFAADEGQQSLATEVSEDGGLTWTQPQPTTLEAVLDNTTGVETEIQTEDENPY